MRFASLEAFGLHPALLASWEAAPGPELLPVQEKAVRAGLLNGRSVVAVAPASAGKTLLAEMALGRAALHQGKGLYLSPTRALAEQKHDELSRRFGPLGLRVIVSTRDHWEEDVALLQGDFDVAVAVPEKARALFAQNPALLSVFSVVVADEIHLLADRERGPALEVLLGDFLTLGDVQILGLTAAVSNARDLAAWLRAQPVEEALRPVELRLGVVTDGEFVYKELNGGRWAREPLAHRALGEGWDGAVGGLALDLARASEATIVFVRDRPSANRLARLIAAESDLPVAQGLATRLQSCPDTAAVNLLRELAAAGVAVHHADLQSAERVAVEASLAEGDVLIVVATSSLALGVNLPARNVIIDPVQWRQPLGEDGRAAQGPLPLPDFLAMAGRAGRLKYGEAFGRAILVAATPLQRDALVGAYVDAELPALEPALLSLADEDRAVALGTGLSAAQRGLEEAWHGTFSARRPRAAEAEEGLRQAAHRLAEAGLFDADGLRPTPRLQAAAGATIDTDTLAWLGRLADGDPSQADALSLLALACATPYMQRQAFPVSRRDLREQDYVRALFALAEDRGAGSRLLRQVLESPEIPLLRRQRAAGMTLAMSAWASSQDRAEVEQAVRLPVGRLEALAGSAAWLMQVAVAMAAATGWPKAAVQRLEDAARAVRLGVDLNAPPEAAPRERVGSGLSRREAAPAPPSAQPPARLEITRTDEVSLILDERHPDTLWLEGRHIPLRPMEFKLLWRLAEEAGACVSARDLVSSILGPEEWIGAHQLYPHLRRIREGIRASGAAVDPANLVMTVRRSGFRLNLAPEEVVLRRRTSRREPAGPSVA